MPCLSRSNTKSRTSTLSLLMADDNLTNDPAPDSKSSAIDVLRSAAQQHLQTIDDEDIQEQKDQIKRRQDLERYAKHKRDQKESTNTSTSDTPMPKMRSAQDVLNRLQWDTDLDSSQYVLGYLERFDGIKEMPVRNWISESTDEDWIPQHRIKYFKKLCGGEEEIVWDRERRVDKIFGKGARASTIGASDETDLVSEDGGVNLMP